MIIVVILHRLDDRLVAVRCQAERAVEHREQHRAERADRRGLGRRAPSPAGSSPSTAKIMNTGGTRLRAVIQSFCAASGGSPGSGGMRGPAARLHHAEREDVDEVQPRHDEAREQPCRTGGRRPTRWRSARCTTATTDGGMIVPSEPPAQIVPRDERLVVGVAQHHRDGEQPDHRLGGADHARRRGEDDAHDDGRRARARRAGAASRCGSPRTAGRRCRSAPAWRP